MNPKKVNKFFKDFAEENAYKDSIVEDVIDFYYKNVRELLTDLKYSRINIDGLGHLAAKPIIVEKSIVKLTNVLTSHSTSTFKAYYNKKAMTLKLDKLVKLQEKLLEEKEKKNIFFKNKKDEKHT
jgi:hypothetical protein